MGHNASLFGRRILGIAFTAPLLSTRDISTKVVSGDGKFIRLGHQLDQTVAALDREADHDAAIRPLDKSDAITVEIEDAPATTIRGLRVKARATGWALEDEFGLLQPAKETGPDHRLASSLVCDLLRMKNS